MSQHRGSIKIAASILAADFGCLADAVREAEQGGADAIHIDMMDGHYVRNISFGFDLIPALKKRTSLPMVVHLELDNPDDLIDPLARLGSDIIVVQDDTCPDLAETIARIRHHRIGAGVGVNPDRPLEPVLPFIDRLHLLVILAVNPGFGGQAFDLGALLKLEKARRWRDGRNLNLDIGVDGGVNEETIGSVLRAGADHLIMGSAIFQRTGVAASIAGLRGLIDKSLGPISDS